MKVKVKICGIRRLETALAAAKAGADFLGFNFVLSSRRFINPMRAKVIMEKLPKNIATVGVFKNAAIEEINEHVRYLDLDFVQLHGNEDSSYVKKIKSNVVKVFGFSEDIPVQSLLDEINTYNACYFMLDRPIQGQGQMIPFEKANLLAQQVKLFIAGGLTPENIVSVVKSVNPFAVDVVGGIETNGVENEQKIYTFISNAKGVVM